MVGSFGFTPHHTQFAAAYEFKRGADTLEIYSHQWRLIWRGRALYGKTPTELSALLKRLYL